MWYINSASKAEEESVNAQKLGAERKKTSRRARKQFTLEIYIKSP